MAVFHSKRDLSNYLFGVPKGAWSDFKATTPAGTKIAGLICRARGGVGSLAGALFVQSVNGKKTSQLLPGMPEIPYPQQHPVSLGVGHFRCTLTEKLDGTAVIFNIIDVDKEKELLVRTRGVPVIFNNIHRPWKDLVDSVANYKAIKEACIKQQATLVFEMYGYKNAHAVKYDFPLRLSLHTVLRKRQLAPRPIVELIGKNYGLDVATKLYTFPAENQHDIVKWASAIANSYEKENNVDTGEFRKEGVILSVERQSSASLWKFKPPSMEEYHRIARQKMLPIACRHLFFKLMETQTEVEFMDAVRAGLVEFGGIEDMAAFEREFWLWRKIIAEGANNEKG